MLEPWYLVESKCKWQKVGRGRLFCDELEAQDNQKSILDKGSYSDNRISLRLESTSGSMINASRSESEPIL